MNREHPEKPEYTLGEAAERLKRDVDTLIHDATQGVIALALPEGVGSWGLGARWPHKYVPASFIRNARNGGGELPRHGIVTLSPIPIVAGKPVRDIRGELNSAELDIASDDCFEVLGEIRHSVQLGDLVVTHEELARMLGDEVATWPWAAEGGGPNVGDDTTIATFESDVRQGGVSFKSNQKRHRPPHRVRGDNPLTALLRRTYLKLQAKGTNPNNKDVYQSLPVYDEKDEPLEPEVHLGSSDKDSFLRYTNEHGDRTRIGFLALRKRMTRIRDSEPLKSPIFP